MESIQAGNLLIEAQQDKLIFSVGEAASERAVVPLEDVPLILDFLNAQNQAHCNRRHGVRLSLDEIDPGMLAALSVSVETSAGDWIAVRPIDMSIAGIHIASAEFSGEYGDQVMVRVELRGDVAELSAVLVRKTRFSDSCAFNFLEIFDDEGVLAPPVDLSIIVDTLESSWLEQNLPRQEA